MVAGAETPRRHRPKLDTSHLDRCRRRLLIGCRLNWSQAATGRRQRGRGTIVRLERRGRCTLQAVTPAAGVRARRDFCRSSSRALTDWELRAQRERCAGSGPLPMASATPIGSVHDLDPLLDCPGRAARRGAARCHSRLLVYRCGRLTAVLVRAVNDVIADRRHIVTTQRGLEGRHSGVLHRAIQHDLVPEIVTEEA